MGSFEIWISPSKGMSSSRIRKIAADTDSADNRSATMTVPFDGANRPTLRKMIASQEITMTSRGTEIEVSSCSKSSQRL